MGTIKEPHIQIVNLEVEIVTIEDDEVIPCHPKAMSTAPTIKPSEEIIVENNRNEEMEISVDNDLGIKIESVYSLKKDFQDTSSGNLQNGTTAPPHREFHAVIM